jgi:WhiB family redox-sensing transcriptional regulator
MTEKNHEQYNELGLDLEHEANTVVYYGVDLDWQDLAECRTLDTGLFFPERGGSTKEAKAVCAGCIVSEDCLEYAVVHERDGIWGGTSERERQRIRRARASSAAQYVTSVTIDT